MVKPLMANDCEEAVFLAAMSLGLRYSMRWSFLVSMKVSVCLHYRLRLPYYLY